MICLPQPGEPVGEAVRSAVDSFRQPCEIILVGVLVEVLRLPEPQCRHQCPVRLLEHLGMIHAVNS